MGARKIPPPAERGPMTPREFEEVLAILRRVVARRDSPVQRMRRIRSNDPFRTAVGTILSARTKDDTLAKVLGRLFVRVRSPQDLATIPEEELAALIRPVGFFRNKAKHLKEFGRLLLDRHGGRVPGTMEELVKLPGIGLKVAAIIVNEAFGGNEISVDTHVHRITHWMGLVGEEAKTPEQTLRRLRELLPRRIWRHVNFHLVSFGQTICLPRRPRCDICPVLRYCRRVGLP